MDHFSYLIDRQHRFLLIGIVLLIMAAVFTLSGEVLERSRGIVSRDEEPKRFWWNVVFYFLAGLLFIAVYLYEESQTKALPVIEHCKSNHGRFGNFTLRSSDFMALNSADLHL